MKKKVLLTLCCVFAAAYASYDQEVARHYARLAGIAYCSKESVQDWSCSGCKDLPQWNTHSSVRFYNETRDVAGYVNKNTNGVALISFRGTSSALDWIEDDFEFLHVKPYSWCPSCAVHTGFHGSYLDLRRHVLAGLDSLGEYSSITITGHSLGAAIAALCAYDLSHMGKKISMVYTYGQPRVGNADFEKSFLSTVTAEYYRVVHAKDPVPHVPFKWMGYHHVPTEVWYPDERSTYYQVCNGSGEDPNCSDSVGFDLLAAGDHSRYVNITLGAQC